VKQGDGVIVPDFTFIATANVARYVGATPVFAEVDERTFNIDPKALDTLAKNSFGLKAIIPVSLFGQYYDFGAVKEVADDAGVPIISDNCQAIGTEWNGKKNPGDDCMVLSFYPTKNITTCEGGAVLTDRADIADDCKLWRNIGQRKPYDYAHLGYNFRMTAIHAAIGIEQLKRLDHITAVRRKNAKILRELLSGLDAIETPYEDPNVRHVYNQFTIKVLDGPAVRDGMKEYLAKNGVGSAVYYPMPLSTLPVFNDVTKGETMNPVAAKVAGQVLSLPVHPSVSEEDLKTVASKVRAYLSSL
jgi:perosamine synthetase